MAATGGEKSDFGAENHGMMTNYWIFFFSAEMMGFWDLHLLFLEVGTNSHYMSLFTIIFRLRSVNGKA